MGGTGKVHFPIDSSDQLVQQFIDQGVGQLHGFWFFEAERSFRQAAALDSDCAAAYWGMAMANLDNAERSKQFIEQARKYQDQASPRVRRYIEALDHLLTGTQSSKERNENYARELEDIAYDYPDDIEAKALLVWHLWKNNGNELPMPSRGSVDALIQQVLDRNPQHPALHYRIHLWDNDKATRALQASALCGQAAPSIAHMWHMPGHIYSRLKRYRDAVWQQEASARVDHARMIRDQILPDQIHNFAHNNEWLIRNLIFLGRLGDAQALAINMSDLPRHPEYNSWNKRGSGYFGRERLLDVLAAGQNWPELRRLAQTDYLAPIDDQDLEMKRLRLVGRAHFRDGDLTAGRQWLADIQSRIATQEKERDQAMAAAATPAPAASTAQTANSSSVNSSSAASSSGTGEPPVAPAPPPPSSGDEPTEPTDEQKKVAAPFHERIDLLRQIESELKSYVAVSEGRVNEALELFRSAHARDPAFEAQLLRQNGKADEGIALLKKHIDDNAQETIPLAMLAYELYQQALTQPAQNQAAREAMERLRANSPDLDLQAPVFARLRPLADQLGWPTDWRQKATDAPDVGKRPELSELGPFRWYPPKAPEFSLPDASGKVVSSADFADRPTIVIMYLGSGCLHCAEQLKAFAPHTTEFEQAGFRLVAISTDDAEGLRKSVEAYGEAFPFPLLADSNQRTFKRFRAYDDFENQPLHATLVLDAHGRICWQDIGYEPFMDWKFVLQEGSRLIKALPSAPGTPGTP